MKKLWYVDIPLQLPIALVAVLFGIVFTAVDFAVVYVLTRGGPFNSTQVLPTWAYAIGIDGGSLGEGAAISLYPLPAARRRHRRDAVLRAQGAGVVTR